MITVSKSLVHGIAECQDCDWRCEDYLLVEKKAMEHAKAEDHHVALDLGYVAHYKPMRREQCQS
jgi:hypothetical protein